MEQIRVSDGQPPESGPPASGLKRKAEDSPFAPRAAPARGPPPPYQQPQQQQPHHQQQQQPQQMMMMVPRDGGNWLVTESVELVPQLASGWLSPQQQDAIQRQVLDRLASRDAMLRHIMEVKVVCNQRRNFINICLRKDYVTLCYQERVEPGGVHFCFFLSDKLEPFVTVTAVDPDSGKLHRLSRAQVEALARTIDNFKAKFGIQGESYHYTPLFERRETDDFVGSGAIASRNKAHSSHFHLKIRVSTRMTPDRLPVYQLFDLNALRASVEPVAYNFGRTTLPWQEVYPILLNDAM